MHCQKATTGLLHAGMNQISEKQLNDAEKQFKTFESMINSMTPNERTNPDLLAKVNFNISAHAPMLMCLTGSQTVLPPMWGARSHYMATLLQSSAQTWLARDAKPSEECLYGATNGIRL